MRIDYLEQYFDEEFAMMPMPPEYQNATVTVSCNDCGKDSVVPFHILGGKCTHCRSYNTTRAKGSIVFADGADPDLVAAVAQAE